MTEETPGARLLIALLHLSRRQAAADLSLVAEAARLDAYTTLKQLVALQRHGWVDARRLRLTLPGLAVAVALDAPTAGRCCGNQRERGPKSRAA